MKVAFCGFGNPDNRGCEALIRTTSFMLKEALPQAFVCAFSNDYGNVEMPKLDSVDYYLKSFYPRLPSISGYLYYASYKLFGSARAISHAMNINSFNKCRDIDLCISIGGDNYCYNSKIDYLTTFHRYYKRMGAKLIHWGSSFENQCLNEFVLDDLKTFDLIMVRESISYDTLRSHGIIQNVRLVPDPAFIMDPIIPSNYDPVWKGSVGINISPLVIQYENGNNIFMDNIVNLIDHLTETEHKKVLLIPHVSDRNTGEGDYSTMQEVLKHIKNPSMCIPIGHKYTAQEYKYIISQCEMFVGARTHSTIAAYSSCVPTLVIGYSVKARGIAKDIFGTTDKYVLPVQDLKSNTDILNGFLWLQDHQDTVRKQLNDVMPEYISRAHSAKHLIQELLEK